MSKVLILNPNTDTFGRQSIPTALISALLKRNNHQVDLFDTTFMDTSYLFGREKTHEELISQTRIFKKANYSHLGLKKEKVNVIKLFEDRIKKYKPDLIIFSFWGSHLHAEGEFHAYFHGLKIIELADTGDIPIVVGGTVPTWNTLEVLKHPKIKYVVRGEGEYAFLEIADRIEAGKDLKGIKNLWVDRGDAGIERNELRPLLDPDDLPYADFDIYDDRCFYRPYHGRMCRCVDYELSRGCHYNCKFCLSPFQRGVYNNPRHFRRERSIERIIAEISYLKKRHKLDIIRYQDETFLTMKTEKLKKLSGIYREKVNLPFIIEVTVPSITEEKVRYLKEMGCLSMGVGLESGSIYIRDKIICKPKFTNEDTIKKVKMVKKAGISVTLYNIIGFPEETKEMIIETLKVNHEANPSFCTVSYFQPWEGTSLRDYSIGKGLLDQHLEGLENSLDTLVQSRLKNLKISEDELKHYHGSFIYYVYIPRIFWSLIYYAYKKGFAGRLFMLIFAFFINLRFKFVK